MMAIFSIKMRASKNVSGKSMHISGAEKILSEGELCPNADALIERALHHAKGDADFINVKIERTKPSEIEYVDALAVSTIDVADADEGQRTILRLLEKIGITNGAEIMKRFKDTYAMRGAMLLDVDTMTRLEPDKERGIRATYMDAEHDASRPASDEKNHFAEAIVLASKVVSAPHIIGEICMSDDPDYVTGYVASPELGYTRITKLKKMGDESGGRIFLYRGKKEDAPQTIAYLEKQKVLVRNVPSTPRAQKNSAPCEKPASPFQPVIDDLANRKKNSLYRSMRVIDSAQRARVSSGGKELIMLASNSYLGLVDHPRIVRAAQDAIAQYGTGSGGSRLTTGTLPLHVELENELASFKGTKRAVLFNTGYMANVGIISSLAKLGAVIFSDELNHASIIDGCRLGHVKIVIYKHSDMADLEAKIKETNASFGVIVSDAVFSMDGDVAPLPDIMRLAKKYGLLSMVDEAHATGVIGKTGRGIVEYFGLTEKPDILMGTMSKSLASEGGFACGDDTIIEYFINAARSFIFSTSLAPATLASALEALRVIEDEPERVRRLQDNTALFIKKLAALGIETKSDSAIVPIIIGDEAKAMNVAQKLYDDGVFLTAIRYPTVARGSARLRAAIMATHDDRDLIEAAEKIASAIKACE